MTESYVIVPVREFGSAKQRLSSFLDRDQRARLARALLLHAIRVLEKASTVTKIVVVSSDKIQVMECLGTFQKVTIVEETKPHGGVNSAVEDGIQKVKESKGDPKILILPSDLPLLSSEAVDRATKQLDSCDILINPSFREDGTNLLAFHLSHLIPLWYDRNSYPNHIREAESRKYLYLQTNWEEFSFDIDDQGDLDEAMNKFGAKTLDSFLSLI